MMSSLFRLWLALLLIGFPCGTNASQKAPLVMVGAGEIDITPKYPVRLSGYGARQKESEGVDQHLFAKAIAIGADKEHPAILLTVDNLAVPAYMREEVAHRLARKANIKSERIALCSTHTH